MTHARKESAVHAAHAGFAHPKRNVATFGIEHGMKVADFGAGSGAYALAFAERLEGSGRVYVVDIQKDLLRRIHNEAARRGFKNVDIVWGDLEVPRGSKIADHALDLVLISNILFQVDDRVRLIEEAERVLKPGGRLVIIDWSESFGGLGPHRDDVVTQDEAYELAHNAGLSFQKEFPAGGHHYGLIFRKHAAKKR